MHVGVISFLNVTWVKIVLILHIFRIIQFLDVTFFRNLWTSSKNFIGNTLRIFEYFVFICFDEGLTVDVVAQSHFLEELTTFGFVETWKFFESLIEIRSHRFFRFAETEAVNEIFCLKSPILNFAHILVIFIYTNVFNLLRKFLRNWGFTKLGFDILKSSDPIFKNNLH